MSIVRDHQKLLVNWDDIMRACLREATPIQLLELSTVSEFIDGFSIKAPASTTASHLRGLLKKHGLDVKQPRPQKTPGTFWVQLASGPSDLPSNAPLLRKAIDEIHQNMAEERRSGPEEYIPYETAVLLKLDFT